MYDQFFDRYCFAVLVTMKKIARLRCEATRPQCLAEKIDDITLAPEFAVADRLQARCFLLCYDFANRCVFNLREFSN